MVEKNETTLRFLMASLKEAQDTTRAYDTKAQIVGVGYIFTVNVIFDFGAHIGDRPEVNLITVTLVWLIVILPIVLFGAVLYPTRKVSPKLGNKASHAAGIFYLEPEFVDDVDTYLGNLENSDPKKELTYEIFKAASLRDIKRRRFLTALWAAAISFLLLFLGQVLRA